MIQPSHPHVIPITHLRNRPGITCQHVAIADGPIVVQRHKRRDVVLVPLRESTVLRQMEAKSRAGATVDEVGQIAVHSQTRLKIVRPEGTALSKPGVEPRRVLRALTQPREVKTTFQFGSPEGTALGPPRCGYLSFVPCTLGCDHARDARVALRRALLGLEPAKAL